MTAREIDRLDAAEIRLGHAATSWSAKNGSTASRTSTTAHYIKGFAYPDGKFRFKPDWPNVPFRSAVSRRSRSPRCRSCPTTGPSIEKADAAHPFRLATSPSRDFLNSTFNETPTSRAQTAAVPR